MRDPVGRLATTQSQGEVPSNVYNQTEVQDDSQGFKYQVSNCTSEYGKKFVITIKEKAQKHAYDGSRPHLEDH